MSKCKAGYVQNRQKAKVWNNHRCNSDARLHKEIWRAWVI